MAKTKEAAVRVLGRGRTAGRRAMLKGEELAHEVARQPVVRKARKKVAKVGGKAAALAGKVADTVTGRANTRKRVKIAAAAVGTAAVAAAAGVALARKRKR